MKKKIIHFHPSSFYSESFVNPLIQFEQRLKYKVTLVNSTKVNNSLKLSNSIPRKYIQYNLAVKNILFLPISLVNILVLLVKIKPTYIISHNIRSSLLPLIATKLYGRTKSIYFNHGVSYLGHKGLARLGLYLIEYFNCLLASHVITVSANAKKELSNLTKTPISLILNGSACGIDLKLFSKKNIILSSEIQKIKNKKSFILTFIGRPEKRKGFMFVMELWEKFFINDKNMMLILCGTDIEISDYLKNPATNIINMGHTDKIPEVISVSNCLLLPSMHEGLPYSILESMAMECPVIANKIPSISSLISNNNNGFLVEGHNHNLYFNKINFIKKKSNFKSIKKITNNALSTAKKFDREKFLVGYNKKIQSILNDI